MWIWNKRKRLDFVILFESNFIYLYMFIIVAIHLTHEFEVLWNCSRKIDDDNRYILFAAPYGVDTSRFPSNAFRIWRGCFFICEWYKDEVDLEISPVSIRGVS